MSCREAGNFKRFGAHLEIPNCDDQVFRAWCELCNLVPGRFYPRDDMRVAQLEAIMQDHDPTYDPYQDPRDDYLTRGR